jgi:hypothetical protein
MQQLVDETIPEKYSTISLGATTIGSTERAPDESYLFELQCDDGLHYIWSYTRKNNYSTIASGATPIGSAERAPDDVYWQTL